MWRAYGGATAGVALVLNITALESDSEALNVFAHPVTYGYDNFVSQLDTILTSLLMNQDLLANLPRERVKAILFYALRDLILTTKHQGFAEEEEWRIIHSPYTFPSDFMRRGTHAIGDLPQNIYKLTLADQPGLNMPELELDTLIHRVVIGPCLYPEQVAHALFHALEERGITNPRDRITVSDIPLRQRI